MARYKRDNPSRTPFAVSARALFVTIDIPDHRPRGRFSSDGPRAVDAFFVHLIIRRSLGEKPARGGAGR